MKRSFLALLFISTLFIGCEKDDICSDETTPRVIIEFFDIANPTVNKNVSSLKVAIINDNNEYLDSLGIFNGNTIELPLAVSQNSEETLRYSLILNSESANLALRNEDFLTFKYSQEQVYVSRACGFKSVFELNALDGLVLSGNPSPDLNWIQNFVIESNTINSEKITHVKIFF